MTKKMKRFKGGDIVVTGTKSGGDFGLQNLDYRLPALNTQSFGTSGGSSGGGGSSGFRVSPTMSGSSGGGGSSSGGSSGFRVSPTMISQPSSTLSNLVGNGPPKGYGLNVTHKFKKGGKAGDADMAQDKALIKKAFKQHDAQEHKSGKGTKLSLAKGGKTKKMAKGGSTASKRADGCATKGKTKGRFV
jgi:hypothetical protein